MPSQNKITSEVKYRARFIEEISKADEHWLLTEEKPITKKMYMHNLAGRVVEASVYGEHCPEEEKEMGMQGYEVTVLINNKKYKIPGEFVTSLDKIQ